MSINTCNLNSHTIDSICGYRRGVIINALLEKKYPPVSPILGTNNQSIRASFVRSRPDIAQWLPREMQPNWTFELPVIVVTVELDGRTYSQTLDDGTSLGIVLAKDLKIEDQQKDKISVNIFDLRIERS